MAEPGVLAKQNVASSKKSKHILSVFENVPDKYIIVSPQQTILTCSNAFLSYYNFNKLDILDKSFTNIFANLSVKDQKNLQEAFQKALQTKLAVEIELLYNAVNTKYQFSP